MFTSIPKNIVYYIPNVSFMSTWPLLIASNNY